MAGLRISLMGVGLWMLAWSGAALAQTTIFESAAPPNLSEAGQYASVSSTFWQGVLFNTTEEHRVTAFGGVMHANTEGATFFLAVFPTDGLFPPDPPDIADAVFVQTVTPPVDAGSGPFGPEGLPDTRVDLDPGFVLPAGDWYICFGSGAADTVGTGKIRVVDTEIGSPLYVNKNLSGWYGPVFSRGFRFFVEGVPLICGDGVVDGEEVCDDGEDNGTYESCNAECTGPGARCGDGVEQPLFEECDDGNVSNRDGCLNDCKRASCGDRFRNGDEECDDGNRLDGDGCSSTCALPRDPPEPRIGSVQSANGGCAVGVRSEAIENGLVWFVAGLAWSAARLRR